MLSNTLVLSIALQHCCALHTCCLKNCTLKIAVLEMRSVMDLNLCDCGHLHYAVGLHVFGYLVLVP